MDKSAGKYLSPMTSPFPKKMSSFFKENEKWGLAPFLKEKVACPLFRPFFTKAIKKLKVFLIKYKLSSRVMDRSKNLNWI